MVTSNVGSRKAPCLGNVYIGPEALPYHDVVYPVVVLSVWAGPRGSSGCFVLAKGVRQHKVKITSPSKMTTVLIRRNAPTDSCRNSTALVPRCTKTSFLITPHYICAHRNSDNLHNAAFKGYSLVAGGMADEHLIVVLHQLFCRPRSSEAIEELLMLRNRDSPRIVPHCARAR